MTFGEYYQSLKESTVLSDQGSEYLRRVLNRDEKDIVKYREVAISSPTLLQ